MERQEDTKHLSEVKLAQQGICACKILIDGVKHNQHAVPL